MNTLKIKLILNNCQNWNSIYSKMAEIEEFYSPKFTVEIDFEVTSFTDIPFQKATGSDGSAGFEQIITTEMVEPEWYNQNITVKALAYDMVLFYVPNKDKIGHITSAGLRADNDQGPVELTIFGMNENDRLYQNGVDIGNAFCTMTSHEIAHGLYLMFGGVDNVHKYFYSTYPREILNNFNFNSQVTWWDVQITKIAKALDFIKKLIGLIKQPMQQPQKFPQKIIIWANAIKIEEGARPGVNNPGNLKYSPLTASWGATPDFMPTDGGNIAKFPTSQKGFDALCNFLVLGCHDELKFFHQARTIKEFTHVYANPPAGSKYAENVARALGVTVETDISTLIS